jgi:septal ring factor EnvC (AmiA/AmiB activator)
LLCSSPLLGQSRAELEKQRKLKEVEIALTRKMLAETDEKQKKTFQYLNVLNRQIKAREGLIGTLQNEVHALDLSIGQENDVVSSLQSDLATLRKEYEELLYVMYKNRNTSSVLSFIFASESFNDLFKRIRLLQFYSSYRERQMDLIIRTQASLTNKIQDLQNRIVEKQIMLQNLGSQKENLENDKNEQNKLAQSLQGQENKLLKDLKQKQRIASKLDKAIHDIIAREIAANKKKNSTGTNKKEEFGLTPEVSKLNHDFASNKSKLPWPVEKGFISETFGSHRHPTLKDVMVNNNGIKIRTTKGAKARAIFQGEVRAVVRISEGNYSVLLSHGSYYSVYSNLSEVYVRMGEKIGTKEIIGSIAENPETGETEMELQLWQSYDKMDPQGWLKKSN